MLIENLIRLGRPMVKGGLTPGEVIRQVSDIGDPKAKGFFEHIIIVEIDGESITVHPVGTWGHFEEQKSKRSSKQVFVPDVDRAIPAPFVTPSGGDPTKPQGRYGVPVYIIYDRSLRKMAGKAKGQESAYKFLEGRVDRTIGLAAGPERLEEIARGVHREVSKLDLGGKRKHMGLLILVDLGDEKLFPAVGGGAGREGDGYAVLCKSRARGGEDLYVDLARVKERLWEAKAEEGAEKGKKKGKNQCFFCPGVGDVVSAYNKAYPWLTTTWEAPLPLGKKKGFLVEGIALCLDCYGALTYGAKVFGMMTRALDNWLTKELFAPGASPAGREYFRKADKVYGGLLALPVLDSFLEEDQDQQEEFVENLGGMLSSQGGGTDRASTYLKSVTGLEYRLPEGLARDDFRLILLYFTGDLDRGDPHLLAYIEDILPSTAGSLVAIAEETGCYAAGLFREFNQEIAENREAFLKVKYSSLPFLLAMAYGYPYLWSSLARAFHRGELGRDKFISNAARRFNELSRNLEKNNYKMDEEAVFYCAFQNFLQLYDQQIRGNSGGGKAFMRDWRELMKIIASYEDEPEKFEPGEMQLNGVEEIGFAAGCLIRRFSNQYYVKTRTVGGKGKDFIKHRMMTFGSSLTPEIVWKRGLAKVEEYARNLDMRLSQDMEKKVAVVSVYYSSNREEIARYRDEFMAAFWSGYALFKLSKKKAEGVPAEENQNNEEVSPQ